MPGTATITAPTGPGLMVEGIVFTGVRELSLNPVNASLAMMLENGQVRQFDLKATTTLTATASSGVFTVTVDQ